MLLNVASIFRVINLSLISHVESRILFSYLFIRFSLVHIVFLHGFPCLCVESGRYSTSETEESMIYLFSEKGNLFSLLLLHQLARSTSNAAIILSPEAIDTHKPPKLAVFDLRSEEERFINGFKISCKL